MHLYLTLTLLRGQKCTTCISRIMTGAISVPTLACIIVLIIVARPVHGGTASSYPSTSLSGAMASISAPAYIPATVALYNNPWSSSGSFYNINANSFEDDEFEQTDFMASVIHSSL